MFTFLLILALVITFLMAYLFFKKDSTDPYKIITKLEGFKMDVAAGQHSDEFDCVLRHTIEKEDKLDVLIVGENDSNNTMIGVIPYEHKSRILHYMNTSDCSYSASFNRQTEKLTIELIEG